MAAIITEKFRQANADAFFADIASSKYYVFVGKHSTWTSEGATTDNNPPTPVDSIADESYYWDDMLGAKLISSKSKFLFINSQINSNNSGQHTLEKFKNANCVLINETEMRHELRDRVSSTKNLITSLSKKLKSKSIIVTRGNEGAVFYESRKKTFITCPAFATNISDKVGAGDAMLSVFSIFLFFLKNPEVPLFFGSLAAANSLKDFGNDRTINPKNLYKFLEHLYK